MELGFHAVRSRSLGKAEPVTAAFDRYRHGAGAGHGGARGRDLELRHGFISTTDRASGRNHQGFSRKGTAERVARKIGGVSPGHRRPFSSVHVPYFRRSV